MTFWFLLVPKEHAGTESFPVIEVRSYYNVSDAGVGDLDSDGLMDRWTTNHSGEQMIEFGQANRAFGGENAVIEVNLSQDAELPGMAAGNPVPETGRQPVRIYLRDVVFVIEADRAPETPVSGRVMIPWGKVRTTATGAAISATEACPPSARTPAKFCSVVTFELTGKGSVEFVPVPARSDGFPITFEFSEDTDLEQVVFGSLAIAPDQHRVRYQSKDRHGFALDDTDHDGRSELFISRGGIRGLLPQVDPVARDEFFFLEDGRFVDRTREVEIVKDGCPGRQTAFVDVNDNGRMDLYQVCGRDGPPNGDVPNRLYIQAEDGVFQEEAAAFGLDLKGPGTFRFVRNTDPSDPQLYLIWVTRDAVTLYLRDEDGRFQTQSVLPRKGWTQDKIAITDLGNDGFWDVLVFSRDGNLLFTIVDGEMLPKSLEDLGLPIASADGGFVDVNSDGITDVFSVPHGLYLGQADGTFVKSDLIELNPATDVHEARFAFYDADLDNDLDLWLLTRHGQYGSHYSERIHKRLPRRIQTFLEDVFGIGAFRPHYWLSELYENRLDAGTTHLAVTDPEQNAGQGTVFSVTVNTPGEGEHQRWLIVGESEMSRASQTLNGVYVSSEETPRLND
ncbi:MAG: VCBS repeat-containing protein [Roseibium sp.]|uniref:FG-GAP repeat domain-containing protein n=1 Tax=Roseibium sp. TaxID=1936156 RepID=UPI003D9C418D